MEIATTEDLSFPEGYCAMKDWEVSRITDFSGLFNAEEHDRMDVFNEDIGAGT